MLKQEERGLLLTELTRSEYSIIIVAEGGAERMQKEQKHIDISKVPELIRIVEEMLATRQPRILSRDDEDVAVLMPIASASERPIQQEKTEADYEAFLSAAGSWNGLIDPDELIVDIYESRRLSTRPPVEL
jgi:vacuolar-type H+-ATPase subunit F/Vma7